MTSNLSNLKNYLNDHLAGATGALELLDALVERDGLDQERSFHEGLRTAIRADGNLLKSIIDKLDLQQSLMAQLAGKVTSKVGRLKIMWSGVEHGELGWLEALEMLSLGIEGKRLMWIALEHIASSYPALEGLDFPSFEQAAKNQRANVEERRLIAIEEGFVHAAPTPDAA